MKFSSFAIKNYKGIADEVRINLDVGNIDFPYVLVGNNESGKTTILNAIELIGKLCITDDTNRVFMGNNTNTIVPKTGGYFTDEIVLSAELLCNEQEIDEMKFADSKQNVKFKDDIKKNNNK